MKSITFAAFAALLIFAAAPVMAGTCVYDGKHYSEGAVVGDRECSCGSDDCYWRPLAGSVMCLEDCDAYLANDDKENLTLQSIQQMCAPQQSVRLVMGCAKSE